MAESGVSASKAARSLDAHIAALKRGADSNVLKPSAAATHDAATNVAALKQRIAELEALVGGAAKVQAEGATTTRGRPQQSTSQKNLPQPPPSEAEEDSAHELSARPPPEKVPCRRCAEAVRQKPCTWNNRTTTNGACDRCMRGKRRCEVPGKKNVDRKRKGSPLVQHGKRMKNSKQIKGKGRQTAHTDDSSAEDMRSDEDEDGDDDSDRKSDGDSADAEGSDDSDGSDVGGDDNEVRSDIEMRSDTESGSDIEMRRDIEVRSDSGASVRRGRKVRRELQAKHDEEFGDTDTEGDNDAEGKTLASIEREVHTIKTSMVRLERGFKHMSSKIPRQLKTLVTLAMAYNEYLVDMGENVGDSWGDMQTSKDGRAVDSSDENMVEDGRSDAAGEYTAEATRCAMQKSPEVAITSNDDQSHPASANIEIQEDQNGEWNVVEGTHDERSNCDVAGKAEEGMLTGDDMDISDAGREDILSSKLAGPTAADGDDGPQVSGVDTATPHSNKHDPQTPDGDADETAFAVGAGGGDVKMASPVLDDGEAVKNILTPSPNSNDVAAAIENGSATREDSTPTLMGDSVLREHGSANAVAADASGTAGAATIGIDPHTSQTNMDGNNGEVIIAPDADVERTALSTETLLPLTTNGTESVPPASTASADACPLSGEAQDADLRSPRATPDAAAPSRDDASPSGTKVTNSVPNAANASPDSCTTGAEADATHTHKTDADGSTASEGATVQSGTDEIMTNRAAN
ncbi:hypothetical protein EIP86_001533 [Pleurotus ostreatoroseus]|nr:hypothetical protein EIP86_001533 [Pleurotus ostreatoroseus]